MLAMLEFMNSEDKLTIIKFSSDAEFLANGIEVGSNRNSLAYIINTLRAGGGTNISAGMEKAVSHHRMTKSH